MHGGYLPHPISSGWESQDCAASKVTTPPCQIPRLVENEWICLEHTLEPGVNLGAEHYGNAMRSLVEAFSQGRLTTNRLANLQPAGENKFKCTYQIVAKEKSRSPPPPSLPPLAEPDLPSAGCPPAKRPRPSELADDTPLTLALPLPITERQTHIHEFRGIPAHESEACRRKVVAALEKACQGVCAFSVPGLRVAGGHVFVEYVLLPLSK